MRKIRWICGVVLIAALVVVVRHVSDAREFARLAEQARPLWLLLAIAFQAVTYVSQGQIYRIVAAADGRALGVLAAARLSITKLFVDQAIPSAGLSGTVAVAAALRQRGISRSVVSAGVLVDLTGIYVSYIICLVASFVITTTRGKTTEITLTSALAFVVIAMGLTLFAITRGGRGTIAVPRGSRDSASFARRSISFEMPSRGWREAVRRFCCPARITWPFFSGMRPVSGYSSGPLVEARPCESSSSASSSQTFFGRWRSFRQDSGRSRRHRF